MRKQKLADARALTAQQPKAQWVGEEDSVLSNELSLGKITLNNNNLTRY